MVPNTSRKITMVGHTFESNVKNYIGVIRNKDQNSEDKSRKENAILL